MKFLVDGYKDSQTSSVNNVITEAKLGDKEKKYYIEGIFAQSEKENRNGRIYPKHVMESAINKYQELIDAKRAIGEMSHPESPQVNLERASHLVEYLKWDGDNVVGRARVLTQMPMGKIAKGLMDEGVKLGVSTRGLGSLTEKNGAKIVQDDFIISAIDIVGDPSAHDAWMTAVMENREWIYIDGKFVEKHIEEVTSFIKKTSSRNLDEAKIIAFQNFLSKIR